MAPRNSVSEPARPAPPQYPTAVAITQEVLRSLGRPPRLPFSRAAAALLSEVRWPAALIIMDVRH
jgi:hypothetical protein